LAGTALLVDDEELVRESTAEMLSDLGYRVVEAESGEEALRLADGGLKFDVLVTDHLMPGMNGSDLARTLIDRFPNCSALIVSGYSELDGISPDLNRLSKPFRQSELCTALAKLRTGPIRGADS
jgi:CheY-like chemotaxis protein